MSIEPRIPFFVTMPHSGEKIPEQATWLKNLPEPLLMCDVDRYVDKIYLPHLQRLNIPSVTTEWHRYAGDLNRLPEDVDASTVIAHQNKAGSFQRGFLWQMTTTEQVLMPTPVSADVHQSLVELIYKPFHEQIQSVYTSLQKQGHKNVFHIDAHSMPSLGTRQHRDPGERRADIVISDCHGKSCSPEWRDLVIASYVTAGFKVGYNWPYYGGRLSEQYGAPDKGQQVIQVELNRALYMDETTKKLVPDLFEKTQKQVALALDSISNKLKDML